MRFNIYWNDFLYYELPKLHFNVFMGHMKTQTLIGFGSWQNEEHDTIITMEVDFALKVVAKSIKNIIGHVVDVVGPFAMIEYS